MNDAALQDKLAEFARDVLKLVAFGRSMFAVPSDDEIMDLAVQRGLAFMEPFDPAKHGNIPDAEEGGTVYAWTFPL